MSNTEIATVTELSDAELDGVAAGLFDTQVAAFNVALAAQANFQANAAGANVFSNQGGNQSNNNNAGNQD